MSDYYLTYVEAEKLLKRAVAERGEDYIYPKKNVGSEVGGGCRNWHPETDSPGCIIGLIAYYILGEKAKQVCVSEGMLYAVSITLFKTLDISMSDEVSNYLSEIQSAQDNDIPWGRAIQEVKLKTFERFMRDK